MMEGFVLIVSFLCIGAFGWFITKKLDSVLNSGCFHSLEEQETEEKMKQRNGAAEISPLQKQEAAPEAYFSFYSHCTKKPPA